MIILMVEDNAGDVYMFREAMDEAGMSADLHVVHTGIEALDFLFHQGDYASAPDPDLVVLDLNLPAKHGKEVLEEMQRTEPLKGLPVAVFTTSQSEANICGSYPGLRCMYALKTASVHELIEIIRSFERFANGPSKLHSPGTPTLPDGSCSSRH